jgi:ribosomal protein L11 methyltransferase
MKYYEVEFTISPVSQDACDIVSALAGEAGFETFEETATGVKGYVQQQLFDDDLLRQLLAACPLPGIDISYSVGEAEDRDWNEQWEQEGFEPISIPLPPAMGEGSLVIHDGRHLPDSHLSPLTSHLSIEIDAHLAFGTGTHETTRMMCASLLDTPLEGKRVLDCGTGTGILAITALKLGAREAVGYDIDEWSADNARHNAVINRVDERFTSLLGDAAILNKVEGTFDVVTANINRNILLADMPAFVEKMAPQATLLLSGFYTDDIPLLVERAKELGLSLVAQRDDKNWSCLRFSHLSPLTSHLS